MAVSIINQFPAIVGGPPLYFVEGLAVGGGKLFYTNSEELFELDRTTGAEIRRVAVNGYINDLEWVGGEIWGARVTPPSIVRFDPSTFAELGSFDVSSVGIPEGVAWDGKVAIFSVDGPPAQVYELDPATGDIGPPRTSNAYDPEALTYGDGALWEAGKDEGKVYKVNRETGSVISFSMLPCPDLHGMDFDAGHLWASSWDFETIYEFSVADMNADPTLSWAGTAGYTTDGVNPDSGNSLTTFEFRVQYTDLDNDAPQFVQLFIQRDGLWMGGSPFAMQSTGDTSYDDGADFTYSLRLAANSTYKYFFWAGNAGGDASGPPTVLKSGPVVSDQPPTLSWVGVPGYVSDGVEPGLAQPNSTPIIYQVRYTGVVPAQYVRVHILRDGAEVDSSPQDMATVDTTPFDGAVYTLQRTLPRSRGYSYYFEAFNGQNAATGPPTTAAPGPIVGNRAPVLDWTGAPGFETDGVDPNVGPENGALRFQVRYTDADGDWPTQVALNVTRSGQPVAGSPLTLARVPGTKPRQGVVYQGEMTLTRGKNYAYWFSANDGYEPAGGPATAPQNGPVVNSPPFLEWVSATNWQGDGVHPDAAVGRTNCEFRVVYRDLDNDAATQVLVEIRRFRNSLDPRGPLALSLLAGTDPKSGQTFRRRVWLNPGTYWYRFIANDGFSDARGVPTNWNKGPVITSDAAAQVTSLSAAATGAGAQIAFTLSAPATVTAEVLNAAGRPVTSLAPKACAPGGNTLLWDGRAVSGLPAPGGLYLIRLTARDEQGGETHALGQLHLRR
jgi:hypothetical protein